MRTCVNLDGSPFVPREGLALDEGSGSLVRVTVDAARKSAGVMYWTATSDRLGTFYLAGPMRRCPLHNFPAFLTAAAILRAKGLTILSPADKDLEMGFDPAKTLEEQPKFDVGAAFAWDFQAIANATGIIMLPGWENSSGAKAELLVAYKCNKEVYFLDKQYRLLNPRRLEPTLTWAPVPD